MDETRFDSLTRQLAGATSRRHAMRLPGGTLAAVGLGVSQRGVLAGGGNSTYAHWCHANFTAAAADQCTSYAAHHTGLAYSQCGPTNPDSGYTPLVTDPSDYASAFCCATASVCGSTYCGADDLCDTDSGTCRPFCPIAVGVGGSFGCQPPYLTAAYGDGYIPQTGSLECNGSPATVTWNCTSDPDGDGWQYFETSGATASWRLADDGTDATIAVEACFFPYDCATDSHKITKSCPWL
jgi:hypothetical protein